MRVTVSLSETGNSADGVIVPGTAIVWYSGKAWVYIKEDTEKFRRIPVSTAVESNGGWFNIEGLKTGDEVVTNGGQLLLSEEFKYQIKNENED